MKSLPLSIWQPLCRSMLMWNGQPLPRSTARETNLRIRSTESTPTEHLAFYRHWSLVLPSQSRARNATYHAKAGITIVAILVALYIAVYGPTSARLATGKAGSAPSQSTPRAISWSGCHTRPSKTIYLLWRACPERRTCRRRTNCQASVIWPGHL